MAGRDFFRGESPVRAANRHVSTIPPRAARARRGRTRDPVDIPRDDLSRRVEECVEPAASADRADDPELASLREAVQARDAFLAVAGHELRNPMGAIALSVSALLFQVRRAGAVPPWVRERLEALERQTRHFVRRSTSLFDIGRLATGKFRLAREATNVSGILDGVVRELDAAAASARCELRVTIQENVIGSWDGEALAQVARGLLSNAISCGAGRPVDVFLFLDQGDDCDMASFGVRDRGPGIAPADVDRIFLPFEQAIGSHESAPLGLGLWAARQLLVAHGGELVVESDRGSGSVFTATLPCEVSPPHS
jgi:two-component system, OmpR family, sensor kinase